MAVTISAKKLSDRVYRIVDGTDVCEYLLVGNDRALLIDTGYGISDLRNYVEGTLNGKPYDVICTHGHVDHAGGAAAFDQVYMNHADLNLYTEHGKTAFRKEVVSQHCPHVMRELSEKDFTPLRSSPFIDLPDGFKFDLGGLVVKMIHVPGHTQGIMVPVALEERTAFFGDACGVGTLLVFPEASTVETYRDSLVRLQAHENEWDKVLRQHGTCESEKKILGGNIGLCEEILARTDDAVPVRFMDVDCLMAKAVVPSTQTRTDGGEGNIMYREDRIYADSAT